MNSTQIRIEPEIKNQLDNLMKQHVSKLISKGKQPDLIEEIIKHGLSYNDFLKVLIECYCKYSKRM